MADSNRRGQWKVLAVLFLAGFPAWFYVQKRVEDIFKKATIPDATQATAPANKRLPVPKPANFVAKPAIVAPASATAAGQPPPPTNPAVLSETLRDTVAPRMQTCLAGWQVVDRQFKGKVTVSFVFKPGTGLEAVEILGQDSAPDGPLSCLGLALWDNAWPEMSAPLTVTYPFELGTEVRETDKAEH